MAQTLSAAATLTCSHLAPFVMTPAAKLTVGNTGVLIIDSVQIATIPTCSGQPPSPGGVKCTKATVTSGQATKLSVGGVPVLLAALVVTTNGNPPTPVTVVPGTASKLFAI
jgi:hypothetical protein